MSTLKTKRDFLPFFCRKGAENAVNLMASAARGSEVVDACLGVMGIMRVVGIMGKAGASLNSRLGLLGRGGNGWQSAAPP